MDFHGEPCPAARNLECHVGLFESRQAEGGEECVARSGGVFNTRFDRGHCRHLQSILENGALCAELDNNALCVEKVVESREGSRLSSRLERWIDASRLFEIEADDASAGVDLVVAGVLRDLGVDIDRFFGRMEKRQQSVEQLV